MTAGTSLVKAKHVRFILTWRLAWNTHGTVDSFFAATSMLMTAAYHRPLIPLNLIGRAAVCDQPITVVDPHCWSSWPASTGRATAGMHVLLLALCAGSFGGQRTVWSS